MTTYAESGGREPNASEPSALDGSWVRNSKLALACLALFLVFWVAQSLTGWHAFNADQQEHQDAQVSYVEYLTTGHFVEATFENWESEFLQMAAFVILTAFLLQKGSSESKKGCRDTQDEDPRSHRADPAAPWPVRRGGVWLAVYQNSLFIAFVVLFVLSIAGHALGGAREYSEEQEAHGGEPVATVRFVTTSQFWFESFQNWQSEFLAVGSIVVLTIFLRQRGSPESKPVHTPHSETGG
jgi:hypothetical protein